MKSIIAALLLALGLPALAQSGAETYLSQNASKPEDTGGQARLMHYLLEDMPIEVAVPVPDDPDGAALQAAARRAFEAWEEAVPEIVDFAFTDQSDADTLTVVWKELEPRQAGSYRYAYSVMPGNVYRYRATEVWLDPRFGPEDTYRFALMEVGHALGLFGRSPYPGDALSQSPSGEISPRDVATLRALYEVPSGTVVNQ